MSSEGTETEEHRPKETKWIDAWIRWERTTDDDGDEASDGGDDNQTNGFETPDTTETYSFRYTHPDDTDQRIDIELDGYKSESEQIWNSTGLTLWRSSRFLCEYMLEHPDLLRNKRILELGSGLGLCGILAHRMVAPLDDDKGSDGASVVLTDGDTDVLPKLRQNLKDNQSSTGKVSVHQLLWGKDSGENFLKHHGPLFDVILGADLVYSPRVIAPLWETVGALLGPESIFIMAYCSRRNDGGSTSIDEVLETGNKAGFSHECVDHTEDIYVHVFRRLS